MQRAWRARKARSAWQDRAGQGKTRIFKHFLNSCMPGEWVPRTERSSRVWSHQADEPSFLGPLHPLHSKVTLYRFGESPRSSVLLPRTIHTGNLYAWVSAKRNEGFPPSDAGRVLGVLSISSIAGQAKPAKVSTRRRPRQGRKDVLAMMMRGQKRPCFSK